MPITIRNELPAKQVLESENIFIMPENRALHQDIRPLKLVILNLMPNKITTETQLLRLLSNSPLQVEIDLLQMVTHASKNTPAEHLLNFYNSFDDIKQNRYDGMIITGAPVEHLPFAEVNYWEELCTVMEWSKRNVHSTLHICWGAQAGLYYHFGIEKHPLSEKLFGIFEHTNNAPTHPLLRGFDEVFLAPHSRYTQMYREDIEQVPELSVLASSKDAGVYIIARNNGRQFFVTGHSEYDRDTLANEYWRDIEKGKNIHIPEHYFPDNDPSKTPLLTWRSHAHLLFSNWLNYFVYQTTPFDLTELDG